MCLCLWSWYSEPGVRSQGVFITQYRQQDPVYRVSPRPVKEGTVQRETTQILEIRSVCQRTNQNSLFIRIRKCVPELFQQLWGRFTKRAELSFRRGDPFKERGSCFNCQETQLCLFIRGNGKLWKLSQTTLLSSTRRRIKVGVLTADRLCLSHLGVRDKLHKTFAFLLDNEEAETSPAKSCCLESLGGRQVPACLLTRDQITLGDFRQLSGAGRYFCRTGQEIRLLNYSLSLRGPVSLFPPSYRCSIKVSHCDHLSCQT